MVEATIKATQGLIFVKYQEYITKIYDLCKYGKPTKSVKRYINNTIKDTLDKLDLDIVTFNKRAHNQHKYAIIFTYRAIKARWAYIFAYKENTKNAIKKMNKMI